MTADLTIGPRLQPHLGHRHGGQSKGAEVADRRFLEQERCTADAHQIEEGLMDLGREIGAVEMSLDRQRDLVQAFSEDPPLERADLLPRNQAEPL